MSVCQDITRSYKKPVPVTSRLLSGKPMIKTRAFSISATEGEEIREHQVPYYVAAAFFLWTAMFSSIVEMAFIYCSFFASHGESRNNFRKFSASSCSFLILNLLGFRLLGHFRMFCINQPAAPDTGREQKIQTVTRAKRAPDSFLSVCIVITL